MRTRNFPLVMAVGEFKYPPAGEPSFTWLAGTAQGCRRDWGRYTTPGAK